VGAQKLEKILSRTLKGLNLWYLKLQVMPLAHHKMPADFIIITEKFNYLIECKQRGSVDSFRNFSFVELTQEQDLVAFEKFSSRNKSFVLLLFWKRFMRDSVVFLISINDYLRIKSEVTRKSLSVDVLDNYNIPRVKILKGGQLEITFY